MPPNLVTGGTAVRPHHWQELVTLPFVGASPSSPPFPYVDLD